MPPQYYKAGHTPRSHECEVWFDGARLPLCIEASEAGGWARAFTTDPAGEILRDRLGHPRTEVLRGIISIRRNDFAWSARRMTTIDIPGGLEPAARAAILAAIGVGARLNIACGYARVDPVEVRRLLRADPQFAGVIFQAQCRHQVRNLLKLEQAGQLQAAVFALERRWPGRFARPRPRKKRKRRRPPPLVDLSRFASDVLEQLESAFAEGRSGK